MLQTLLEIFATIANLKSEQVRKLTESYIEIYLSRLLSPRIARQQKEEFSRILLQLKNDPSAVNIANICKTINKELSKGQRVLLLINLIEFVSFTEKNALRITQEEEPLNDFIEGISDKLKISKKTLQNCKNFVSEQYSNIPDQEMLVFAKDGDPGFSRSRFVQVDGIKGFLVFLYIEEANIILFKYNGSSILELNSRLIFPKNIYTLHSGSIISLLKTPIIYYSQIIKFINKIDANEGIILKLNNVEFTHKDSSFGVKRISFSCSAGELIGIIGGSGSGKTTLLNIINGNLTPNNGYLEINGINYANDLKEVQKLIGFVPQDDSLIGELTTYENLYFTTSLSFADFKPNEIKSFVENKLSEFSLYHIRNQRVGHPVKRKISGGQRKRLNIISELVREPHILLVDEPTSGLSSSDSYKIVVLLKEQASRGKLVIINIHQPSSEIFRLFDKILVVDQGGYMVFYGNPIEAIDYFKEQSEKIDNASVECITCHTLKSDEIFEIIEEKLVDELGEITETRKRNPEEWSNLFLSKIPKEEASISSISALPPIKHKKPSRDRQFKTFLKRFLLTKLRDKEFIIYSLSIPTLLAFIVSFFSKYSVLSDEGKHIYNYYENDNIPVFFLMSIIACLFTGIIITADCMIRDSLLRKREKFLFLDQLPYINSKVTLFVTLSVIQTIIFTVISVLVLQIPGSILIFWFILFISSIIGNMTGIIVSSVIKSTAAVYIIVPFLIIPQIIFSGIALPFEKLNYRIAHREKVPLIGNLTFSRWGIEALLVKQFKDNEYEKLFFDLDMKESQTRIKTYFLIPELLNLVDDYQNNRKDLYKLTLINDGLLQLNFPNTFLINEFNNQNLKLLTSKILETKESLISQHSKVVNQKNALINQQASLMGSIEALLDLKSKQMNKGVEKFVLNRQSTKPIELCERKIVQNTDPIFLEPTKGLINAHFFTSEKIVFGFKLDTYLVNSFVLLFVFFTLYTFLIMLYRFRDI